MTRMEERRAELGWSQEELAVRAGVHRQTVMALELGRYVRRPRAKTLGALASALGVPVPDLLREAG